LVNPDVRNCKDQRSEKGEPLGQMRRMGFNQYSETYIKKGSGVVSQRKRDRERRTKTKAAFEHSHLPMTNVRQSKPEGSSLIAGKRKGIESA